jgi:immune inhibitor A
VAIAALGATALPTTAASAAPQSRAADSVVRQDPAKAETVEHNFKGPLSDTQSAQRQQAIEQVISGESKITDRGASGVVELDNGKYVELQREKTDKIFTILAEFGDSVDPRYGGTAGPAHNEIAQPDRATDNSAAWQADYN